MKTPLGVAVVGASPDAAALARAFDELPQATLRWHCDETATRPHVPGGDRPHWTSNLDDVLEDEAVDVVVFAATRQAAHGRAAAALEADKHVFVNGAVAFTTAEAEALVTLATRRSRVLWSHLEGTKRPSPRRLRDLVGRNALGEIYYVHARRYVERDDASPGLLWGAGAEAVAQILDLLGDEPIEALARAGFYLGTPTPDVMFLELEFATGIAASIHLSCLEGEATDSISVVGADATAKLDAGAAGRELTLYRRSAALATAQGVEDGAMVAYRVPPEDTARAACDAFVRAVRSPGDASQHGREAASTVAVLEALEQACARTGSREVEVAHAAAIDLNVVELRRR